MSDPAKQIAAVIRPCKPGEVAEVRIYGTPGDRRRKEDRRPLLHIYTFPHYGAALEYARSHG